MNIDDDENDDKKCSNSNMYDCNNMCTYLECFNSFDKLTNVFLVSMISIIVN